MLHVNSQETL